MRTRRLSAERRVARKIYELTNAIERWIKSWPWLAQLFLGPAHQDSTCNHRTTLYCGTNRTSREEAASAAYPLTSVSNLCVPTRQPSLFCELRPRRQICRAIVVCPWTLCSSCSGRRLSPKSGISASVTRNEKWSREGQDPFTPVARRQRYD